MHFPDEMAKCVENTEDEKSLVARVNVHLKLY